MDELINIYNGKGIATGEVCLKSEAHQKGLLHASIHVWIFDKNKNILIQKRAGNKDSFPNMWDISVAGHISAGELPIISALREVEEEIGLVLNKDQLHFIGTSKKNVVHHQNFIDNEIHFIYLCETEFQIDSLIIQKEEVSEIDMIHLNDLIIRIDSKNSDFVPRENEYYNRIFKKIKDYHLE